MVSQHVVPFVIPFADGLGRLGACPRNRRCPWSGTVGCPDCGRCRVRSDGGDVAGPVGRCRDGGAADGAAGVGGSAGTKTFRAYDQDQVFLLPPSLNDWLPEGHLGRMIDALIEDTLDLTPILASYVEERRFPPYDPRLMLKVLIYGYATGTTSSRKLARACEQDVAMRFLAANQAPDHRSIAEFRKRHIDTFEDLFVQVLQTRSPLGRVWSVDEHSGSTPPRPPSHS